jgi:hypothetical protein
MCVHVTATLRWRARAKLTGCVRNVLRRARARSLTTAPPRGVGLRRADPGETSRATGQRFRRCRPAAWPAESRGIDGGARRIVGDALLREAAWMPLPAILTYNMSQLASTLRTPATRIVASW